MIINASTPIIAFRNCNQESDEFEIKKGINYETKSHKMKEKASLHMIMVDLKNNYLRLMIDD